jgi:hypothetical protein
VWGTSVGLGRAGSSAILARACCSGHVGWLWLGLRHGVEGWVFCALGYGREGLSQWVVGLVFAGGSGGAFVWMETLAQSSGWYHHSCLQV